MASVSRQYRLAKARGKDVSSIRFLNTGRKLNGIQYSNAVTVHVMDPDECCAAGFVNTGYIDLKGRIGYER